MTDIVDSTPFIPFFIADDLPDDLIERLCGKVVPPMLGLMDLPEFVRMVCASMSLSSIEKLRVFENLPALTQFQIDSLIEVFNDELAQFTGLIDSEWPMIASFAAKNWLQVCMLADYMGAGYPDEATEREALRQMLLRKFAKEEDAEWAFSGLSCSVWGRHVFSALSETQQYADYPVSSKGKGLPDNKQDNLDDELPDVF